jgi:hypothetical protein
MILFYLRHYEPLVDRIVIFDDHSTAPIFGKVIQS